MKNFIIAVFTLLVSIPIFAQTGGFASHSNYNLGTRMIDVDEKAQSFGLSEAQFDAIKNDAYANPNFIAGNIYQDEQLLKKDVPMRYNAYADEIEIKMDPTKDSYGALTKDPSIYVKLLKDIYVLIPYEGSNEKGGYFSILADGKKYDLYKKVKSVFNEPYVAKTSYESSRGPSFSKQTTYYLVENGKFYELPDSKSKILKVMDSKKKEVKSYIRDNNIDLAKESDLIKLVTYFDSLL